MRLNRQRDVIAVVRPEVDLVLRESERLGRDLVLAREHLEAGAVGRTRVVIVVDGGVALHRHRDFLVGEQDLDRFCDANSNQVNEITQSIRRVNFVCAFSHVGQKQDKNSTAKLCSTRSYITTNCT